MTELELALEIAKTNATVSSDLIKVGIPGVIALVTTGLSTWLAYRLHRANVRMADKEREFRADLTRIEARQADSAAFLQRRREQLERASEQFSSFADKTAIFYTQIIAKQESLKTKQGVPEHVEEKIKIYDRLMWESYSDANNAKRILKLNSFEGSSRLLIDIMSHASRARGYYQGKGGADFLTIDMPMHLKIFRRMSDDFHQSMSADYRSLIVST